MTAPLAALAVHYWKLCAAFDRELGFMNADRAQAGEAQLRFARRKLDTILAESGLRIATYDGAPFTAEIPASPVNAEDIADGASAIVEATIEPTVTGPEGVLVAGKILLKEA
ncbi:hypothetical protein GCM10009087_21300 [Sphingomonas oligophenolica]|uniref:Nucleotide exchange factor GrpE n=1 Tax=Sphingomonas oligophenolica TaxID=301154 RepID=A0ABU9Y3T2_9SPHN